MYEITYRVFVNLEGEMQIRSVIKKDENGRIMDDKNQI